VKAANVQIESYWPGLFAKLAEKRNIEDLIMNVGSGGGAAVAVAAPAGGAPAPADAPAAEEKKVRRNEQIGFVELGGGCLRCLIFLTVVWFVLWILQEPVKEESEDEDMGFSLFD